MNLHHHPFTMIKSGQKTIEMRLKTKERENIKSGDVIVFTDRENQETLSVTVISVSNFPTFKELYEHFDKSDLGYLPKEDANYEDMYQYYNKQDIAHFGVIALQIKVI